MTLEQTVIACIALHVLADFTLQTLGNPSLADLKQKAWWRRQLERIRDVNNPAADAGTAYMNTLERKYGNDYKAALWCHAALWAVLTFLPLWSVRGWFALVALNAAVHYVVDDLKANRLAINLVEDQVCHLGQILGTVGAVWLFRLLPSTLCGG